MSVNFHTGSEESKNAVDARVSKYMSLKSDQKLLPSVHEDKNESNLSEEF